MLTRLRRPLVGLVALFTLGITLDRVGVGHGADTIGTRAYVVAALAVMAALVLPRLRRARPFVLPALATAGCLVASTLSGSDVAGSGADVYAAIAEISFVALAALLAGAVARALADLDDVLGAVAFGPSPAADIESPTAAGEIHAEMARSRRHGRPLSLTVLAPVAIGFEQVVAGAAAEVDRAIRERYVVGKLSRTVGDQLRRSDLLFEHRRSGRLFILSPETDQEGTELLVERVVEAAARAGIPMEAGTAAFPDQAVGFEGLVAQAEQDLATRRAPERHLRAVGAKAMR